MSSKIIRSFASFVIVAFGVAPLAACSVGTETDDANAQTSSAELSKSVLVGADAGNATLRKGPSDTLVANPSEGTVCDICGILSCACVGGECIECGSHLTANVPSRP